MNRVGRLSLGVLARDAHDARAIVDGLLLLAGDRPPDKVMIGRGLRESSADELRRLWSRELVAFSAKWCHPRPRPNGAGGFTGDRLTWVNLNDIARREGRENWCAQLLDEQRLLSAHDAMVILRALPFKLAMASPAVLRMWPGYSPALEFGMGDLGWMVAYQGDGHSRLASRRVLNHLPARVIRDEPRDITLIQLHDLDAEVSDEATLQQARLGHEALTSAHIPPSPKEWRRADLTPNFYDSRHRTSIVLVQDREVSAAEMRTAAWFKRDQPWPDLHVEQVAFVYFDEVVARRQLFDLWRFGLECRLITANGERRLDTDFEPPAPVVPEWVKRARDREPT